MTQKQQVALLISVVWITFVVALAYAAHQIAVVGLLGLLFWFLLPLGKNASVLRGWHNLWIVVTAALGTAILSLIAGLIYGIDPPLAVAMSGGLGVGVGLLVKRRYHP